MANGNGFHSVLSYTFTAMTVPVRTCFIFSTTPYAPLPRTSSDTRSSESQSNVLSPKVIVVRLSSCLGGCLQIYHHMIIHRYRRKTWSTYNGAGAETGLMSTFRPGRFFRPAIARESGSTVYTRELLTNSTSEARWARLHFISSWKRTLKFVFHELEQRTKRQIQLIRISYHKHCR